MKLLCIKNNSHDYINNTGEIFEYNLTINKIYDGSDFDNYHYHVLNDNSTHSLYPKENFKPLDNIREEKLSDILK